MVKNKKLSRYENILLLFIFILSSPHIISLDIFRYEFGVIGISFCIFLLVKDGYIKLSNNLVVFYILIIIFAVSDILFRENYIGSLSWIYCFMMMLFIDRLDYNQICVLIIDYVRIIFLIISLALIIFLIDIFIIGMDNLELSSRFPGYDSILNIPFINITIPRITYFLIQSSLIPAYVIMPLSIVLIFTKVDNRIIFVLMMAIILSFGGSVYTIIFSAIFIFYFSNYFKIYSIYIFLSLIMFLLFVIYYYWGVTIYDYESNFYDPSFTPDNANYLSLRLSSGDSRLALISTQIDELINNFWLGLRGPIVLFGNGALTSGLRSGFLGLILFLYIFHKLLASILVNINDLNKNNIKARVGLSLLLACIIQFLIYNDYGYSLGYGFLMLFLVYKLFSFADINNLNICRKMV